MSRARRNPSNLLSAVALLIALFAASAAFAVAPSPLQAGSRLRATLKSPAFGSVSDPKRIEGRLLALDDTALVLETSHGKSRTLPLDNLAGLERSVRPSRNGRGALIGLGAGALILAGLILAGGDDHDDDPNAWDWSGLDAGMTAVVSFWLCGGGALAGAIIAPGEKWEPVPDDQIRADARFQAPPQVQVGFAPMLEGGGRVGVSVRF